MNEKGRINNYFAARPSPIKIMIQNGTLFSANIAANAYKNTYHIFNLPNLSKKKHYLQSSPNFCKEKINSKHPTESTIFKRVSNNTYFGYKQKYHNNYLKFDRIVRYTSFDIYEVLPLFASHYTYLIKSKLAYYTVNKLLSRDC